jgi:type I restriction enzyme S subunit
MFAVRSEPARESDQMLTASQKYGVLYQKEFVEREGRRVVEVILGRESLKHVEPDDFIISMRSFQGGLEWSRLRGSTSFHYVMVRPVKGVYPPFFAHLFKSALYIQALRATTDLIRDGQELRYSNFVQVDLPIISVEEQMAIAEFLDRETAKIDALVEEQKRLIELLKEKRQAVISQAVTKGLDPNVPMKDSGVEWLGEIPRHWQLTALKRLCATITDGAHISPETENGVFPFVSTRDISEDCINFDDCLKTSEESFDLMVRTGCRPHAGDVLFSKDGTIGRTVVVDEDRDFVVASSLIIIRPKQAELRSDYLNFLFQSNLISRQVDGFVKGAGLPRLSIQNLRKVIGVFPPVEEQQEIAAFVSEVSQRFDALGLAARETIGLLQERRSALISAAVTGKIDVRGLVSQPEAVAA